MEYLKREWNYKISKYRNIYEYILTFKMCFMTISENLQESQINSAILTVEHKGFHNSKHQYTCQRLLQVGDSMVKVNTQNRVPPNGYPKLNFCFCEHRIDTTNGPNLIMRAYNNFKIPNTATCCN